MMSVSRVMRPFLPHEPLLLEDVARLRVFAAATAVAEKVELRDVPVPAPEAPAVPDVPVELNVQLEYRAEFGQVLRMIWWEKERNSGVATRGVLPMTWSEGHVWQCRLARPKRSFICFRFEVCLDKVNAVIRREFLGKRRQTDCAHHSTTD